MPRPPMPCEYAETKVRLSLSPSKKHRLFLRRTAIRISGANVTAEKIAVERCFWLRPAMPCDFSTALWLSANAP